MSEWLLIPIFIVLYYIVIYGTGGPGRIRYVHVKGLRIRYYGSEADGERIKQYIEQDIKNV